MYKCSWFVLWPDSIRSRWKDRLLAINSWFFVRRPTILPMQWWIDSLIRVREWPKFCLNSVMWFLASPLYLKISSKFPFIFSAIFCIGKVIAVITERIFDLLSDQLQARQHIKDKSGHRNGKVSHGQCQAKRQTVFRTALPRLVKTLFSYRNRSNKPSTWRKGWKGLRLFLDTEVELLSTAVRSTLRSNHTLLNERLIYSLT